MRRAGDDVGGFSVTEQYDVVMAGSPCQPWSRAYPDALFFDDDRADVYIHCAGIMQDILRVNPAAKYMMANVVISDKMEQSGDEAHPVVGGHLHCLAHHLFYNEKRSTACVHNRKLIKY